MTPYSRPTDKTVNKKSNIKEGVGRLRCNIEKVTLSKLTIDRLKKQIYCTRILPEWKARWERWSKRSFRPPVDPLRRRKRVRWRMSIENILRRCRKSPSSSTSAEPSLLDHPPFCVRLLGKGNFIFDLLEDHTSMLSMQYNLWSLSNKNSSSKIREIKSAEVVM